MPEAVNTDVETALLRFNSEYLLFLWDGYSTSGKTSWWSVRSRRGGGRLGRISWFGRWRQYAFFPDTDTVWNTGCLDSVQSAIAEAMVLHGLKADARKDEDGGAQV